MKPIVEKIAVNYSYPVSFTRGVFDPTNRTLADTLTKKYATSQKVRALVVVDGGLAKAVPGFAKQIETYFKTYSKHVTLEHAPLVVPGGEAVKNDLSLVNRIFKLALESRIDRHGFLIAVGGGAVLDMAGFSASVIHRGLRFVRIPTTVLSQADAGIGVKNGMDFEGTKNFCGTFAPPYAVINDAEFLKTLPDDVWFAGLAEAFKVAIIKDKAFFKGLCKYASALKKRDLTVMEQVVYRTAELHLGHIKTSGDPFEFGTARPLDFGHWAAHRLEVLSGYKLSHGFAVSIGMCLDCAYAVLQGFLPEADRKAVVKALSSCGLPVWSPLLEQKNKKGVLDVLDGLDQFREHLGGDLCITLPSPIGSRQEVHTMDITQIGEAIALLKGR